MEGGERRSPLPSKTFFRLFLAKTNEKRTYTTLNKPRKVIFAYNRLPLQNPRSLSLFLRVTPELFELVFLITKLLLFVLDRLSLK
jgi:hypothetical protein